MRGISSAKYLTPVVHDEKLVLREVCGKAELVVYEPIKYIDQTSKTCKIFKPAKWDVNTIKTGV